MEDVELNFSDKARRDFDLVQEARLGNQKAYADLMGYYKDSIYFMLLKMVNNKSDAEDLTIEAFGKAFKNLDKYTPNFAFSTWLFKIATNNCIDYLRKKRMTQRHVSIDKSDDDENEVPITLVSGGPNPEEKLIGKQKERIIKEIINKLNPRYRELIEMRYFDQLSYQEIAEELNLPIGTVKARLFRARELLLNVLENNPEKP